MSNVKTTKIGGGADYAKVADRIKMFWEQNPNGKIESERESLEGGKIRFIARIWLKADQVMQLAAAGASTEVIKLTANATASADATKKGDKENEKLETVAVGRALAMLGYLASGEVASREEMEQFEDYKAEQLLEEITKACESLKQAPDMLSLQRAWTGLPLKMRQEASVFQVKEDMKKKLSEEAKDESDQDQAK